MGSYLAFQHLVGSMWDVWDLSRFKRVLGEPGDSKGDQDIQMGPGDSKRGSRVPNWMGPEVSKLTLNGSCWLYLAKTLLRYSLMWLNYLKTTQKGILEVPKDPLRSPRIP